MLCVPPELCVPPLVVSDATVVEYKGEVAVGVAVIMLDSEVSSTYATDSPVEFSQKPAGK